MLYYLHIYKLSANFAWNNLLPEGEKIMNLKKKIITFALVAATVIFTGCGHKSQSKPITSIDGLKGARIGTQLLTTGHLFAEERFKDDKETQVLAYSKGADAIAALKQGALDCVIIDEETAKIFVDKNNELKILDAAFEIEEYAVCVNKDNKILLNKIDYAIDELKLNGSFDKIVSNYIGDKKGETPYEKDLSNDFSNGKLIMATNAQFPPYEFYENDKIIGIDVDFAKAIADKLKMELIIEDMEFDTIVSSVQSGKSDIGMAGISISPDREKSVAFSHPYVDTKQVIITKNLE